MPMSIQIEMPIPRFPIDCFLGFCQFRLEKKEFTIEMKTLHDFPYFLMHIMPFDMFPITKRQTNLSFTCSKSKIQKLEQDMKHV